MTKPAAAREHLLALLGPVVSAAGYDLEDVTVTSAGRRSLVRVSVDSDSGIDLDAVAEVSRLISDALDGDGQFSSNAAFAGPYVLEVGSPGVDRPLTEPRHWRRAVGRLVKVDYESGGAPGSGGVAAGGVTITGRVVAATDAAVTLDVSGTSRDYSLSALGPGKVQVEFNRADEELED